jgi:Putative Na+/H+ antiporter
VTGPPFPPPLDSYPVLPGAGFLQVLQARVREEPLNLAATLIFLLAIAHTFSVHVFAAWARRLQARADARASQEGRPPAPSVGAEVLHFFAEVEVVFGLWALVLCALLTLGRGFETARHYLEDEVNYTEPMFVVVIMALASTRPILGLAEDLMARLARLGGGTPAAWWLVLLTFGPLLGSLITEPAAMTITALLLSRQVYELGPSRRLAYATLGLLFVNVSAGGTLTHFAAPPILMVARPWSWDSVFVLSHFGWKACVGILAANGLGLLVFRRELASLRRPEGAAAPEPTRVPAWIVVTDVGFMAWTVVNAHYPALFIGGFLFFLGFAKATSAHQGPIDLRPPLLVGFFLAGLVIHAGLQGWWIAPLIGSLGEKALLLGSVALTAFNDNALITYLATLVPHLGDALKAAVVAGAVTGGGLTVIANAPNPAGQAILGRHFADGIAPLGLALGAMVPTLILCACFLAL